MKAHLARALVRWASRSLDASYSAWCRVDRGEVPDWYDKPWSWYSRRVNRIAVPLALRIDKSAAVDRMVEESWWG